MVQWLMLDNVPRKTGDTRERLLELAESAVLAKDSRPPLSTN